MNHPKVTMQLRVATKQDFFDIGNIPLFGTMYFMYSLTTDSFCTKPYYFSKDTPKEEFNILFKAKKLFVPVGFFDDVEIENV